MQEKHKPTLKKQVITQTKQENILNNNKKTKKRKERLKLDTLKRSSQALILTAPLYQIYHKSLNMRLAMLN